MRFTWIICSALLVAPVSSLLIVEDQEREKQPLGKATDTVISKLVEDLGSESFAIRDSAMKRLRKTPAISHILRERLKDMALPLEVRRRLETLVRDITSARFKSRLANLTQRKHDAPIDVIADLVLANRQHVTETEWKLVLDTVAAIGANLTKGKNYRKCPTEEWDFRNNREYIGTKFELGREPAGPPRVIADELHLKGHPLYVFGILSQKLRTSGNCSDSIFLVSGDHTGRQPEPTVMRDVSSCFVYCDGDLSASSVRGGIIITTGRARTTTLRRGVLVETDELKASVLIENAHASEAVKLFTTQEFGLILAQQKELMVDKVVSGSEADTAGFKSGDKVILEANEGDPRPVLMRRLRKAYAEGAEITLIIRREGRAENITLSFVP